MALTNRQLRRRNKKQSLRIGASVKTGSKGKGIPTPKAPRKTRNQTLGPKGVRPNHEPFIGSMRGAHTLHDHTGTFHAGTGARLTPRPKKMGVPDSLRAYTPPKGHRSKVR
jgi:hypothetical protein